MVGVVTHELGWNVHTRIDGDDKLGVRKVKMLRTNVEPIYDYY